MKCQPQEPCGMIQRMDGLGEQVSKVSLELRRKPELIKKIILNDTVFCLSLKGKRCNQVISYPHQ